MNNKKTIQKILIGLGIAIALLVVYSMLAPGTENQGVGEKTGLTSLLDSSVLGQIEETDTKLANAEILRVLGGIRDIELKDDIFTNPVFKKLRDSNFSIPNPIQIGRDNPFLPIGFETLLNTAINDPFDNLLEERNSVYEDNFFGDIDLNNGQTINGGEIISVNNGGDDQ